MRQGTIVVGVLIALVLLPMWYVGIQGESPSKEIEIDRSVSHITPLGGFVDAPNKLSPSQVGVIVWVALFALYGVLAGAHRFMNAAVRPAPTERPVSDGGGVAGLSWLRTTDRRVVEYDPPNESTEGIVVMGALTVLAIVFAALFTGEYLTLARTQFFGVYAAGLFLSLAALTVAYYAWFMPHILVAERRGH
ncbi:MAG: hypothetical protein ABEJ28_12350 [Salinigranum sp.]